MNLKNRFTQREVKVIGWLIVTIVLILFTLCLMCSCVCRDNSLNFSLINSRSPSINAGVSNSVQAATGFTGGGHLEADIPLAP